MAQIILASERTVGKKMVLQLIKCETLAKQLKLVQFLEYTFLYHGGDFDAHSWQCSADSSPQGKEQSEGFSEKQENRYENTFRAEQSPVGQQRVGQSV